MYWDCWSILYIFFCFAKINLVSSSPNEEFLVLVIKLFHIFILESDKKNDSLKGEEIDYNERFWWTWDQGRFGFGPYGKYLK